MKNTLIRCPRNDELPALLHIWESAFGDDDMDAFFAFYADSCRRAAVVDDTPVAAGYLLHAGNLICDGQATPCAMIYAVAVLPEFRNRGLGAGIVSELISAGREAGYPAIVLCPSEDSLFEFYGSRAGFHDWFSIVERALACPSPLDPQPGLCEISPEEYCSLREDLLCRTPHIETDVRALSYQSLLCRQHGGGLFRIDAPDGVSCAVIERQPGGTVWVKELLTPEVIVTDSALSIALSALAPVFPASEYIVRTLAVQNDARPGSRRFGMLAAANELISHEYAGNAAPWFGMAFD